MDGGEKATNYAWESEFKMSWDSLSLQNGLLSKPKPALTREYGRFQRGLMRNLVIVVDASRVMGDNDYQALQGGGNRFGVVISLLKSWAKLFYNANPLGSILLIGMRDGIAERWSPWTSNAIDLSASLDKVSKIPLGDPSLQNAIDLARNSLLHVPKHISKEVLIIYGSLYTCDPGNILDSIDLLVNDSVRTSIIGLSGSVRICETLATSTKGNFEF